MKKKINNTHLTYEGRQIIENMLDEGKTVTQISKAIRRDRSNIGREIIKHRILVLPSVFNNTHPCLKNKACPVKSYECYLSCKNIEVSLCPKLTSSPHICNACISKKGCRYAKYYYKAFEANCEYTNQWKNIREGLRYTEEELNVLNTDLYYLVLKNKSIFHSLNILNKRGFNFKISTIYKQIRRNQLKLKRTDLPRKRNENKKTEDISYKRNVEGCTYDDYNNYCDKHQNSIEMQMDTVEGVKENNAPVILTLEIVKINFLFIFKLDSKTNQQVIKKLNDFKSVITTETFNIIMEILLTDNGTEFINVDNFKKAFPKINLFYCHPYSSFEKGSIENTHELIRRVIPKGVSLKYYLQSDFDLLCSHINSLCRNSLNGKCPFDLIKEYISIDKLKKLNLRHLNEENVILVPELLGDKNVDNIKKHLDSKEIEKANIRFLTTEEKKRIFGDRI